jgi:hypothetical protein
VARLGRLLFSTSLSDFVNFRWIANNAIDFLEQFLCGFTQTQILEEEELRWIYLKSNPKPFLNVLLPINPHLTENPFY